MYLQGLLLDGERKSIEPLSRRVTLPDGLVSKDPEQALQQFVNQSPWDGAKVLRRYRAHLARTFAGPDLSRVHVLCTVETRDRAHIVEVQQRLAQHGVELSRSDHPQWS